MKKMISLFLIVTILFAFSACSTGGNVETTVPKTAAAVTDATAEGTETSTEKKILTIYFSSANTVDATSSATPYFDGVASTQYLAEYIRSRVGGDIAKITPVTDYPEGYDETADAAKAERMTKSKRLSRTIPCLKVWWSAAAERIKRIAILTNG